MLRDLFMNKWVLGGIGFLIVFSVACVFWYQHDTADERKAAAEVEELLRQSELSQKTDTDSVAEQVGDVAPAESVTLTVNKEVVERTPDNETPSPSTEQPEDSEKTEVLKVSPHGFGAYPEVPEEFPTNIRVPWLYPEITFNANLELATGYLSNYGIRAIPQILGANYTDDQKVYPYYPNTVYVEYQEHELKDGIIVRTISNFFGPPGLPEITDEMMISGVIPGVHLIDVEEGAIDALQFLNFK